MLSISMVSIDILCQLNAAITLREVASAIADELTTVGDTTALPIGHPDIFAVTQIRGDALTARMADLAHDLATTLKRAPHHDELAGYRSIREVLGGLCCDGGERPTQPATGTVLRNRLPAHPW